MTGVAVFYTPDSANEARDDLCPRMYGVTLEQAREMSADYLVMWTATNERFAYGIKVPSPDTRFFWQRSEIVNPWAFFRPLDPYPVRSEPRSEDRHDAAGRQGAERPALREITPDAARLFDAFD
ncbi:hypothetical protein LESZY_00450 [Brevundimonas phage vB_BpoS-Leszy]|nr:hypothetical protein LESZY_00450 [Brevundimonas phage vB_BpoS-Leszy]